LTITQFDAVQEFYDLISQDVTLKPLEDIVFLTEWDVDNIRSADDPAKRRVCISLNREGTDRNAAGGARTYGTSIIKIEVMIKTGKTVDSARDMCEVIRKRIRTILQSATFSGTGWVNHWLIGGGYSVAPIKTDRPLVKAYYVFNYEVKHVVGT